MRAELQNAFRRYARLRAWGRDLSSVPLRLLHRPDRLASTGEASLQGIRIVAGRCPYDAHATLLHELAHMADGPWRRPPHGTRWRERYALAVAEETGFLMAIDHRAIRRVDDEAVAALRAHLKRRA